MSEKFYSVVIPINPKGQVLMGKRKEDGIWTTPAGGSEGDESPETCAIREAYEEALLEIVPNQLEFLYKKQAPHSREAVWCYLFRCAQQYTSPEDDPDDEVPEWLWLTPDNFPKEFHSLKNKVRKDTIMDALAVFHGLAKAEPSKEKEDLLAFIQNVRQDNPEIAERLYQKVYPHADQAQDTELPSPGLKKSTVHLEHQDGASVNTGEIAQELLAVDQTWLGVLTSKMEDFQDGDVPVTFLLPKGILSLTRVGDSMFSGSFQYKKVVINAETGNPEEMRDNAKVRIERMTLPSLCIFLQTKGWVKPLKHLEPKRQTASEDYAKLDRKIQILSLLERLTS